MTWAQRLKRVFNIDITTCEECGGIVKVIAVSSPTTQELTQLTQTIARRVGRYLERQGLLERDAENSYLTTDAISEDPMNMLLSHSMT